MSEQENYERWEAQRDAIRREIEELKAADARTRFDNDDSARDEVDERIRQLEGQLAAIEAMLAGRRSG